jgi:hypothetical protein
MDSFPPFFNLDAMHSPPDEEQYEQCLQHLEDLKDYIAEMPASAADIRLSVMRSVIKGHGVGRLEIDLETEEADVVINELKDLGFFISESIAPFYDGTAEGAERRTLLIEKYHGAALDYIIDQDPGHCDGIVNGFASGGLMSANAFGFERC